MWSSPRTWGCFLGSSNGAQLCLVFPTHVGVFLGILLVSALTLCLPHARGGVSPLSYEAGEAAPSSPRTWGCFYLPMPAGGVRPVFPTHVGVFLHAALGLRAYRVFPTHVGVFPSAAMPTSSRNRLPHARGGVSEEDRRRRDNGGSSPRTWGCFWAGLGFCCSSSVFPTHVGVFPCRAPASCSRPSLPHARGGVSNFNVTYTGDV